MKKPNLKNIQANVKKQGPQILGVIGGAIAVGMINKKLPEMIPESMQDFVTKNPWVMNAFPMALGAYLIGTSKEKTFTMGLGFGMFAVAGQKTAAGFGIGDVNYLGDAPEYIEVDDADIQTVTGVNYLGNPGEEAPY